MSEVVFSGVQPTGDLHIGNYYGAIKNFVAMQDKGYDGIYCVVDLHAMTDKHDPKLLEHQTLSITAAYVAAGLSNIGASRSIIFAQSTVPQHTEMAWMLNCVARMGWMERMTQFKDKGGDNKERASVGLFTYPILMAADILLYQATRVPVGADQKQHLELARDIAQKFNKDFGAGSLAIPSVMNSTAPRIMSLGNADKKMSKSSPDPNTRINLSDSADVIAKKIRKATADTQPFPDDLTGDLKPEVANLITIFKAATGASDETIVREFGGKGYGVFKPALAEALIAEIVPLGKRMAELMDDPAHLKVTLRNGRDFATPRAEGTIRMMREKMGLVTRV